MYPNRPRFETADADAPEAVTRFRRDGYIVTDFTVAGDVIERVTGDLKPHWYGESGNLIGNRVHNAWRFSEAAREIAGDGRILALLEQLYGRAPVPFQTLHFAVGSRQRAHVDGMHFNTIPAGFLCGAWLALEDVDERNGPIEYYVDSHWLPHYELLDACSEAVVEPFPSMDDYRQHYEDFLERIIRGRGLERREIHMKAGQVLIWSGSLCHGGAPILDQTRTRFSQVTHYFFRGCTYYTPRLSHPYFGNYWLRRVRSIVSGEEVEHVLNGRRFTVPARGRYRFDRAGRPVWLDRPSPASRLLAAARSRARVLLRRGR